MSNDKLIVVIGITGQQGGSVANVFQSEPGWRIRGITRDPSKPLSQHLKEAGIELVAADLDDPASLDRAFKDADAIFSVTDFWQFLQPGSTTYAEAEKAGLPPNQLAMQKEITQGRNIIDAAAKAHAAKPLHRFVVSTLSDSLKWSNGEITSNLHFDGKAKYVDYLKAEHPELAKQSSYLQIGYYLKNWKAFKAFSIQESSSAPGTYLHSITGVADGKPIPYVHPPNDTGHFVRALVLSDKSPPGTTMLGFCALIQGQEYVRLWGETLGVKTDVHKPTVDELVKGGLPEWLAIETTQSGKYVTTWGWDGGEPGVKSPEEGGVEMAKLTDIKTWVKESDWSSILQKS